VKDPGLKPEHCMHFISEISINITRFISPIGWAASYVRKLQTYIMERKQSDIDQKNIKPF
jgi:hypothetical protein